MARYFARGLFAFLDELASNNNKTWWEDNKGRYQAAVRDPALAFIADFAPHLRAISPQFVADARVQGGSLMRPHRDIRFSPDKTPYKTNVGIQFRHAAGRDVHAPGFYLHLEPGGCFAGAGMWHPETAVARRIRQAIYDDSTGWAAAAKGADFTADWSTAQDEDEMLRRVPTELSGEHPHADDLKMKSFIAMTGLSQRQVTADGFDQELAGRLAKAAPFTRFLCDAIGVPF